MANGIGVEIGLTAIRTVILERTGSRGGTNWRGQVKLVGAHETACDTSSPEALARGLVQVKRLLRISQPIILGISSTSAILTSVNPLIVNPRRASLAVAYELQQQVPFDLAQAVWDYRWLARQNGHGNEARSKRQVAGRPSDSGAAAAAMRRALLDQRLASCRQAGLTVRAVVVSPIALMNAWQAEQPSDRPQAAVLLHFVTPQAAEWIVATPSLLRAVAVTGASPEELWDELSASWQGLNAEQDNLPNAVQVVNPPMPPSEAQRLLAQRLSVPVEIFSGSDLLKQSGARVDHPERCLVAMGLALQGLDLARLPLNLLASAQGSERARRARGLGLITSSICVAVALVFAFGGMIEVRRRRLQALRALEARERLYQSLRPEVRGLLQRQQHLEQRTQQLEHLADSVPLLAQTLAQAAEALPEDVWLTRLDCSKSGLMDGQLEGRAKSFQDVTKFLERLKSVAGMSTVKPLSTNVVTDAATGKEVVGFVAQVQRPLAVSVPQPERGSAP